MSHKGSTALYYISHFLLAGQPAEMLERLWITYDIGEIDREQSNHQADESSSAAQWETLNETLKESYRATGVMAALIASAAAALIATPYVPAHSATLVLLLASITCSIMSVFSATSFLSHGFYKPIVIRELWKRIGLLFVIWLSMPLAWLSHALLTFQAALLSLAWLNNIVAVRIVITLVISFRFALDVTLHVARVAPFIGIGDALLWYLGARKMVNHKMITPTKETIKVRNVIFMQRYDRFRAADAIPDETAGHAGHAERGELVPMDVPFQESRVTRRHLAADGRDMGPPEGASDGRDADRRASDLQVETLDARIQEFAGARWGSPGSGEGDLMASPPSRLPELEGFPPEPESKKGSFEVDEEECSEN